jgi:hypothetical protein
MDNTDRIIAWLKAKDLTPEQFAVLLVVFTPERKEHDPRRSTRP